MTNSQRRRRPPSFRPHGDRLGLHRCAARDHCLRAERRPFEVVAGICAHRSPAPQTFDTAADCAKVVPHDYKGTADLLVHRPDRGRSRHRARASTRSSGRPGRRPTRTSRPTRRTSTTTSCSTSSARRCSAMPAPMVVRLQILGGVEFAAKGYLQPLKPEDVGYSTADFWPGAMKSVTYDGVGYGIPTNNETMAFIWNAKIFKPTPASIPRSRRPPGTTSSSTPSRSTTSSASPATAWSPSRTPATRRSASCPSSGPTVAARSTKPARARPTRRSG